MPSAEWRDQVTYREAADSRACVHTSPAICYIYIL